MTDGLWEVINADDIEAILYVQSNRIVINGPILIWGGYTFPTGGSSPPPPPPPVLTSITVSPSTASVNTLQTQQFTAIGYDQYGSVISAAFTWSATAGSINSSGLFTAGSSPGSSIVTAASGLVSRTASVTVTSPPPPPPPGAPSLKFNLNTNSMYIPGLN